MQNEGLLFQKNVGGMQKRVPICDGAAVFKLNMKTEHISVFGYAELKKVINFCNSVHTVYRKTKIPIYFNLGDVQFVDKLVYVIFECLCDSLIREWGHDVYVRFQCEHDIWTEGIHSSPLLLLTTGKKEDLEKYLKKFETELYRCHYRKILSGGEQKNSECLSRLTGDIIAFLKNFGVQKTYRNSIAEVISELLGNAGEHTASDCLVDLDVSRNFRKFDDPAEYYGINIAIMNYSSKLLGSGIREKILNLDCLDERHKLVKKAYEKHSLEFSENYTEQDFFHVASFQHRISEREVSEYTGGTGLTKLIKSLEQSSEAHHCFVMSGNRVLRFQTKYLEYNSENWIGFNNENEFLSQIPDLDNIVRKSIFFPGTAYNLNFVMKGE